MGEPAPKILLVEDELGLAEALVRGLRGEGFAIHHVMYGLSALEMAEAGVPVPDGSYVIQDNPRRGFVAQVPDTVPDADVLDWLLRAAAVLAAVPLSGDWRVMIHFR